MHNRGLKYFNHDPLLLRRAAAYVEDPPADHLEEEQDENPG